MTALVTNRLPDFAGLFPARGTYPIRANVHIFKGAKVGLDSVGRAMPAGPFSTGCVRVVGVSSADYDNRTGSSYFTGLAEATNVEVEFGVFSFLSATGGDEILADDVGKVGFSLDDQTLALTNQTDTLPIGGIITEVRDSKVFAYLGPHVSALVAIAASEASQLDTAQTEIDALQADALSASAIMPIPLTSFLDADGDPLAKFVSAGSPTFGFNLADSEALCLRWNNDATPGTALCQIALPPDLDDAAAAQLEFLCSKSGATVGDATTLTIAAFIIAAGDLHDADANAGGITNALTGNAVAKTTALLSRTIAAADIPANARSMTFTVTPTAGLLGTDDLLIHDVRLRYQRKLRTS